MVRLIGCLVLLCLPALAWGQEARVLTLEQAIAQATRENPNVRRLGFDVDKSADRLAIARTMRLPSFEVNLLESQTLNRLDFQFGRGVFGTYPGTGPIPAEDTRLSTPLRPVTYLTARAAQPLSQLHRINLGMRLEELRGEAAREKQRAERQAVVKDVKRLYYEMLSLQSSLETVQENIKLYRELDRVVTQYVAEKAALKAEGLDARMQLAAEELAMLGLRNTLASRKEQFNALLGWDLRTEFALAPVVEAAAFELDLTAAQQRALAQRPELNETRLLLKQAELDQQIKRSQYIPDVSLVFSYLRISPVNVLPPNIASVGVMVTWEPFDWGRKKHELAEKGRTIEQARLTVSAAETQAIVEINALFRKLQEARATLRVAQLAQESAREKARVAAARYGEQAALLKDVLGAQSQMAETSKKYQQALLAFWEARAQLEKALGEE